MSIERAAPERRCGRRLRFVSSTGIMWSSVARYQFGFSFQAGLLALKRLEVPWNLGVGHEGGETGLDIGGKGGGELLDQRPKSRPSASGGAFVARLGRGWSTARPIV